MSTVFKAKTPHYMVPYESLFGIFCDLNMTDDELKEITQREGQSLWAEAELEQRQLLPASNMIGRSYTFSESEGCNQLTLATEVEIDAMRKFILSRPEITEIFQGGKR